ncbi:MAG: HAMP domain-containing histidine kinase [Bacteroidales bacterium]|nr:HAMP domain-containing histidine kinase [Bacteroidales bacterium]
MIVSADTEQDLDLLLSIIENNNSVPVILADGDDNIITSVNLDEERSNDMDYLKAQLAKMKEGTEPITIDLGDGFYNKIYYKDSNLLTELQVFPYIQIFLLAVFITIAYLAFNASKKMEENQVWTGLSKETAHQLGTPTSSLSGWVEILEDKYPETTSIADEIRQDVERLEKITDRFSGIGKKPILVDTNVVPAIMRTVSYLKSRVSSKVEFNIKDIENKSVTAPVNMTLLEWVIENISKNAIDAMEGAGVISYAVFDEDNNVIIDISDTGKGLSKKAFKTIFKAGYTTKKHGWGLGLSLARRVIEDFHNGKLFVKESEIGKGTTIRIVLKKSKSN